MNQADPEDTTSENTSAPDEGSNSDNPSSLSLLQSYKDEAARGAAMGLIGSLAGDLGETSVHLDGLRDNVQRVQDGAKPRSIVSPKVRTGKGLLRRAGKSAVIGALLDPAMSYAWRKYKGEPVNKDVSFGPGYAGGAAAAGVLGTLLARKGYRGKGLVGKTPREIMSAPQQSNTLDSLMPHGRIMAAALGSGAAAAGAKHLYDQHKKEAASGIPIGASPPDPREKPTTDHLRNAAKWGLGGAALGAGTMLAREDPDLMKKMKGSAVKAGVGGAAVYGLSQFLDAKRQDKKPNPFMNRR